jgi:hypothetical protein
MPSPEPTARWAASGTVRANPIGVRPTPGSPQTDDAKKDPNADGADKADWPMAGILAKPQRAGFENEILGLRQGGIPPRSTRAAQLFDWTYTNPKHRVRAIRNSDAGHCY